MPNTITQLKIGTRGSKLALKQTNLVIDKLKKITSFKKKFSLKIIKLKPKEVFNKEKILNLGIKDSLLKK